MLKIRFTCVGTAPLLMHNARLSNPLDPVVKEIKKISAKRGKTDDDYEEVSRLEHMGGMYFQDGVGPYLPGSYFRKTLIEAARKTKRGRSVEQGVFITTLINPLAYTGPRDLDGLWQDKNFVDVASVKLMSSRVMRTRPIFHEWACDAEATLDVTVLDFPSLVEIAETGGAYIGFGDYRPLYGRFTVRVEDVTNESTTSSAA